jgi:GNAT superfamily N-acetyltransferase
LASLSYEKRASRWRESLANADSTAFVYVAQDDNGTVVGFAGGGPERDGDPNYKGELYAIYLHPDYLRRGIGRQLAQNPSRQFYEALGGKYLYEKRIESGGANLIQVAYGWPDIHALAHVEVPS